MIDHVELRVPNPEQIAKTIADLFGSFEPRETSPGVWEVHFRHGNHTFLEIKSGDPNPAEECTRAISRLAFCIEDTDVMLPKIFNLDPNAEDLGWSDNPVDQRRIVRFSIGNLLCHTIEWRFMITRQLLPG